MSNPFEQIDQRLGNIESLLLELKHQASSQAPTNQKTILDFTEGCAYMEISKSHGYKLTSKGLIPHSKRGKKIYFEKAVLDEYMTANRIKTVDDLEAETNEYLRNKKKGDK